MKYPYTVKQDGIYYSPGTEVPDLEEKKAEELPEKPVKEVKRGRPKSK